VALAIASSFKSRPLLERTVAIGEVSLSGDLRRVPRLAERLREAQHLGFRRAGVPRVQAEEAEGAGLQVIPLATLRAAYEMLLGERVESGGEREPGAPPTPREREASSASTSREASSASTSREASSASKSASRTATGRSR
jgi:predicted ATPase with chaperone activity